MAYTSGDTLVRAVMMGSSGLPKDQVTNDFAFHWPSAVTATEGAYFAAALTPFYNTIRSTGFPLSNYISNAINRAATHRIDVYHIVSGALGSPFFSVPWLGPSSNALAGLPAQVAGVISFQADQTGVAEYGAIDPAIPSTEAAIDQGAPATHSGRIRPRARHRGRLYVGPLSTAAVTTTSPPYLLSAAFLTTLREAFADLVSLTRSPIGTPANNTLGVWSRRDQMVRVVTNGWTDDRPDVQRRRARQPSTRTLFTV